MFRLLHQHKNSLARLGELRIGEDRILTPCFMPVATSAIVKGIFPFQLYEMGIKMILVNIYHLYLRPGIRILQNIGGIHQFMNWRGRVITDSGGYQIFSLKLLNRVTDEGVSFQSHIDGSKHFLTPEEIIRMQMDIHSDILLPLDECVAYPCDYQYAKKAMKRTSDWAKRSKTEFKDYLFKLNRDSSRPLLFGIIQGSIYRDLREESLESLLNIGFDGYALGGLSVGEDEELRYNIVNFISDTLPSYYPRYLMGLGTPQDILKGIEMGVDLFDCVIPTRYGRNGTVFGWEGKFIVRDAPYKDDFRPLDDKCDCFVCRSFTRAYIRHLFNIRDLTAPIFVSYHNVYFYHSFIQKIREAIREDSFFEFKEDFLKKTQCVSMS